MLPVLIGIGLAAVAATAQQGANKGLSGLRPPSYRIEGEELVSVIIPTYEEKAYIESLLISIQNQTYSPIETIISDASGEAGYESTKVIADKYGALIVNDGKLNVSYGRNIGAGYAKGRILVFCDADCVMANDYIERLVNALNQGAKIAHGVDYLCDAPVLLNIGHGVWNEFAKPRWYTSGRGVGIRPEDFWFVGGYSENQIAGVDREDIELALKIIDVFGKDSVVLDRDAVVVSYNRRPIRLPSKITGDTPWDHRAYREGTVIDGESWG